MSGIEFSASGPAREPKARARPSPRERRRAIALGILAGVLTACVMLAIDAAVSAHRMLGAISAARLHLIDGGNSVVTGDPDVATAAFQAAGRSALEALGDADRPGVRLLQGLPIVGDNVTAAKAVAQAQVDTASAGLTMADAARTMDWNTILLPTTTSLGHVDLAEVRRATPQLESVATQLQTALNRLELAGGGHLIGPVAAGYDNAVTTLTREAALAADARDLARVTPPLFGGHGVRRYLVAVGSLAQPFGPSGRVGPVGVLTARHGTLTLEPFSPADPVDRGRGDLARRTELRRGHADGGRDLGLRPPRRGVPHGHRGSAGSALDGGRRGHRRVGHGPQPVERRPGARRRRPAGHERDPRPTCSRPRSRATSRRPG